MPDTSGAARMRAIYDEKARRWRWNAVSDVVTGFNRLRRRHLAPATGAVLDIGCGTGENLPHLRGATSVTALDVSPEMVRRAADRAQRLGLLVHPIVADAAALPFADGSFDVVTSAGSSCTFPAYVGAFKEMVRVAKPDGRILLVEHGRSSVGWIARRQDRGVERVRERFGCRNNRDVMAELDESGVPVRWHRRSHLGMLHRIELIAGA
jgi:ubiquinone/menaquinone biosynthesis C-methylase UbiE